MAVVSLYIYNRMGFTLRHALQGILCFDKRYYKVRLQVERGIL